MNTKSILTGIIALIVAVGGWFMLSKDTTPPLIGLPSEESSIKATAVLSPEQPMTGEPTTIIFSFTDVEENPVTDLMVHHARRIHTLLLSEDLSSIGHIHSQDFTEITDSIIQSGQYSVTYTFPKAGRYIVGIDVMNMADTLEKQFVINVKGKPKMGEIATGDFRSEKCFRGYTEDGTDRYVEPVFISESVVACPNGYKVTFTSSVDTISAGEEVRLQYHIEKGGNPVTNLEPFLDAAIHFAIVPTSLDTLLHRHGVVLGATHHEEELDNMMEMNEMGGMHQESVAEAFGPNLVSETMIFPKAGLYQIFAQVQHDGQIIFTNFMINVQEDFDEATAQVFDLAIVNQNLSTEIVAVTQDDKVIFRVYTDEIGEFHVAGYEIENEMELNGIIEIRFTANLAGRYNLELHPTGSEEDIVIGAFVVNPR